MLPSCSSSLGSKVGAHGEKTSQSRSPPEASAEKHSLPCVRASTCTVAGCARHRSRNFRCLKSKITISPFSPPLTRLLSASQWITHRPPSGWAEHEATSACDGGRSTSQRQRLLTPAPCESPTVARITALSTKQRSPPRLEWHWSLLNGSGISPPLWKRHSERKPSSSILPNCSEHRGLILMFATRPPAGSLYWARRWSP
mmetsp:Transcript_38550/g.101712  ORF Transcript_38550/g.101712 Transcript_38550/m.101712 type:complete len:200 (-) Transcript_38550:982-1581(-)